VKSQGMCFVICGGLALAGCGGKQDANAKNFAGAISQALEKGNELCLGLSIKQWPVKVWMDAPDDGRPDAVGELAALDAADLVKGGSITMEGKKDYFGNPTRMMIRVKSYELTAMGKRYFVEKGSSGFDRDGRETSRTGDFCYGKGKLGSVVRWEGPQTEAAGLQNALVVYTYDVEGLPDWAKRGDIQKAFPSVARVVGGIGKTRFEQTVWLTSDGWVVTNSAAVPCAGRECGD